ncbi:quinate dehydrogenase [Aspergillus varians]
MEPVTIPADRDGVAYLYGHPLRNSLSPPLHQTVYNALGLNWTQIPLSTATDGPSPTFTKSPDISAFLASIRTNPKFVGSSVTMPWKVAIMPHLDDLTEDARQAGACNTIFLRKDSTGQTSYVGTNTDCIGIREALLQGSPSGPDHFKGKPALIVGGGGTARTAVYVLRRWLGASKIYIVNRDAAEVAAILAEDKQRNPSAQAAPLVAVSDPAVAATLEAPVAVVSGIPNYPPQTAEEVRARETLRVLLGRQTHEKEQGVILEMCYHPAPWTEIAQMAADARWKVILGSEALIWQGLEQARLWTGTDVVAVPGLVEKVKLFVAQAVAERSKSNL